MSNAQTARVRVKPSDPRTRSNSILEIPAQSTPAYSSTYFT
uniref:Uncharacterized protein n=1 Tax=Anguilla anguilla TaxID=7936 RepID=A0A0E9PER1_ANGAN